jgi:uncharacterized protein (DUF302 family)/uncharacterized membrane protein YidH (DUF202 family)
MNNPIESEQSAERRDRLAAERTFLAWVRTGVALMGFGFVVARFGLFLQELRLNVRGPAPQPQGITRWFGTALIIVGIVAIVHSVRNYTRQLSELDRGEPMLPRTPTWAVSIALLLALLGLALAINLVLVQSSLISDSGKSEEAVMASTAGNGLVSKPSNHSVDQTLAKLEGILAAKGVTIFALIDHSGEAEKVGMHMRPTKLLIFGNPKAGTPLMLAAPGSAIDLPLKILIWEDAQGKVWVTHNSPAYLQQRHNLPPELLENIAIVETLAAKAAE